MAQTKNTIILAMTGKVEASYGAGAAVTLAPPDSIQPAEFVTIPTEYAYDGGRPAPLGGYGSQRRAGPNARSTTFDIPIELKGSGSAPYTALSKIPNTHDLFLACGLSASLASATMSFVPLSATGTPQSVALALYSRGEIRPVSGCYGSFTIATDNASPGIVTFNLQGLPSLPADSAVPSITYAATDIIPPKSENIGLVFNFGTPWSSAVVRGYSFAFNREIAPRLDLNNDSGHGGFAIGRRTPEFNVQVEAAALSSFNPQTLWSNATTGSIIMTVGDTAGNKWQLELPKCQISNVVESDDGPTAMWDLTFSCFATEGSADDDFRLRFF